MKSIFKFFFLFFLMVPAFAQKPKLVIGIVVDQLRFDYLERMDTLLSDDGFKRIVNQGYNFRNAHYNYAGTYTGPGHTSIYTGTTPSEHGIVGNHWYNRNTKKFNYCTEDASYKTIGDASRAGEMSPSNLFANTLCDELKLSSNFKSKVIALALKDRGAILPGGRAADAAYWYSDATGNFITSSYYINTLPKWLVDFNNKKLPEQYMKQIWSLTLPLETYTLYTTADNVPYERPFIGESRTTLPYKLENYRNKYGYKVIKNTPYGNSITFELAKAAIQGEALGQGAHTDFLALSFSTTDYIGHQFGPNSVELWDMYVKMDQELSQFLQYLDQTIGKDQYTLFLTSDNGAAEIPLYMNDKKLLAGYMEDDFKEELQKFSVQQFGDSLVEAFINLNIYVDYEKLKQRNLNKEEVFEAFKNFALNYPEVHSAFTSNQLNYNTNPRGKHNRVKNGHWAKRSGDVILVLHSGYINSKVNSQGTTHGSPYNYDTRIPILFYGQGIKKGSSVRYVEVTDIAPTISLLLQISLPSASTGLPLVEIFEEE